MKAILEFKLPEESVLYGMAIDGGKYKLILHEFSKWLEKCISCEEPYSNREIFDKLQEIKKDIMSQ